MKTQLKSKQNTVFLVEDAAGCRIEKIFTKPERLETELAAMDILRRNDIAVPRILQQENSTVWYEYVAGMTVLDTMETERERTCFYALLCWLQRFYTTMQTAHGCPWILGDIHLRNFLVREGSGEIVGIDFEECRPGAPEADLAWLCAFVVTYDPAWTAHKLDLAAWLYHTMRSLMPLDAARCSGELDQAFAVIANRRKQQPDPEKIRLLKRKMFKE